MTGHVLAYSVQTNTGAISGDDGNRYMFTDGEWRIADLPQRGMRVDFDPKGTTATGIYGAVSPNLPTPSSNNAVAAGNNAVAAVGNAMTTARAAAATSVAASVDRVGIEVEFASPLRRIIAWIFDSLLLIFTLGTGLLIWLVIAAVLGRSGQSPGKALLGIRVVRRDGSPPGFGLMLGRTLCRFLSSFIIPFASIISFVMMLSDQRRRTLHDHMVGTLVVRKR